MTLHRIARGRWPRTRFSLLLLIPFLALALSPIARAQSTTIFFDNEGPEQGITTPGACCFSFSGADFIGFEGVVAPSNPALTASGEFVYRVVGSDVGVIITFDPPVDFLSFFFVHDPAEAVLIGSGFAYDMDGMQIAGFESNPITTLGDPANFISIDSPVPIRTLSMWGFASYLDNLTFGFGAGIGAGAVPDGDRVPGPPLVVGKEANGDIRLSWSPSCLNSDADYAVYEGLLGDPTSHIPVGNPPCTTAGATETTITPALGDRYYLVVPQSASHEGSYGTERDGEPRLPSASACREQLVEACQ